MSSFVISCTHVIQDVRDDEGQTPLEVALNYLYHDEGCVDVALYLINLGCGGDEHKRKLLCGACWRGKLDVIKELVKRYRIKPNSKCNGLFNCTAATKLYEYIIGSRRTNR